MGSILHYLATVKQIFVTVCEAGFALVGLIVLLYLLLGADAGPYVISVVANLSLLIDAVGQQTLIAIAIVYAILQALKRRV